MCYCFGKSKNMAKLCRICGDKALNAVALPSSCQACRQFFVRNYAQSENLQCINASKCDITQRKLCPKCRMSRCLEIGMDFLLIDKENVKIGHQRRKLDNDLNAPQMSKQIKLSPSKLSSIAEILEAIVPKNSSQTKSSQSLKPLNLTRFELAQLCEINRAMAIFHFQQNSNLVIELHEYCHRTIRFCTHIETFKTLNFDAQRQFIKSFTLEVISLCFALNFSKIQKTEFAQIFPNEPKLEKTFSNLHSELNNDLNLTNLLLALLLVKNFTGKISSADYVRYQYFQYSFLLQRYLQFKCGCIDESVKRYLRFTAMLSNEIAQVKEMLSRCLFRVSDLDLVQNKIISN